MAYLNSLETPSQAEGSSQSQVDLFETALREAEALGRSRRSNVWEIIETYPKIIQPVAKAVSCLPSTQVSVERMFSQLKLLMRDNRASMGAALADGLLYLRMNRCI